MFAACADKLYCGKANIFVSVAREIEPFLTTYQTDKPMVPFLADDLCTLVRSLMTRFAKSSVLADARTPVKLLKVPITTQPSVHCETAAVDLGFAADQLLKDLRKKMKISQKDVLAIKSDTKQMLVELGTNLLTKTPLNYCLVWNMRWLDPDLCVASKTSIIPRTFKFFWKCINGVALSKGRQNLDSVRLTL